jgi:hypothetical protein
MTEQNAVTTRKANEQFQSNCNVSQKFNFTVGTIAVLAAVATLVILLTH